MSDNDKEKRKLKLMTEVLPDPRLARAARDQRPRERTIEHLKRLLTLAAGATAVAACSKGYAVVDPLPPPSASDGAPPPPPTTAGSEPAGSDASAAPDGAAGAMQTSEGVRDAGVLDAAAAANPKTKAKDAGAAIPPRGYMVVDPLPPPPLNDKKKRDSK